MNLGTCANQRRRNTRLGADGVLRLTEPYRWHSDVRRVYEARCRLGDPLLYGSYLEAAFHDEQDRCKPRTASLCFDVKKGWEPLLAP